MNIDELLELTGATKAEWMMKTPMDDDSLRSMLATMKLTFKTEEETRAFLDRSTIMINFRAMKIDEYRQSKKPKQFNI